MIRDPNIKEHSPERLRYFAKRFREMALRDREQVERSSRALEAKALRYLARADKLEKN